MPLFPAGMDILCSDKTGTLTLNKLSVDANTVFPMSGHSVEDVLKFAALSAQRDSDEAIDKVGSPETSLGLLASSFSLLAADLVPQSCACAAAQAQVSCEACFIQAWLPGQVPSFLFAWCHCMSWLPDESGRLWVQRGCPLGFSAELQVNHSVWQWPGRAESALQAAAVLHWLGITWRPGPSGLLSGCRCCKRATRTWTLCTNSMSLSSSSPSTPPTSTPLPSSRTSIPARPSG